MKIAFAAILFLAFFSCRSHDQGATTPAKTDSVSREAEMTASLAAHPDSLELLQNLVRYYLDNEQYDLALTYTNKAIARDSLNPELWDMKSVVEVEKADTTAAISSLEQAVAVYADPRYLISLGALYAETRNPKALKAADILLSRGHADREALFIKGLYYSFGGQKQQAIRFFDQALDADPRFMNAYLEKSLALYDEGDFAEAAKVLEKATTLQNNFDVGYYYLGRCYEKLNRPDDAAEQYRKALLYDPDYTEAGEALARLTNNAH